jgi:hypothetical protein
MRARLGGTEAVFPGGIRTAPGSILGPRFCDVSAIMTPGTRRITGDRFPPKAKSVSHLRPGIVERCEMHGFLFDTE